MSTDGIFMTKEKAKIYRYALKALNGSIRSQELRNHIHQCDCCISVTIII